MLSVRCPVLSVCLSVTLVYWPNGWTDQDETWHAGRPRPRPQCVRWDPAPLPKNGAEPASFRPMSVVAKRLDGSRCHLVRRSASAQAILCYMATQLPLQLRGIAPNFRPMPIVAKRLDGSRCHLVRRQASARSTLCFRWGPSSHPPSLK